MSANEENPLGPPDLQQIRAAIRVYLLHAYGGRCPPAVEKLLPPDDDDPVDWLMSDAVERDPAGAPLGNVRSFALRLGNEVYPHMKLRLSRPPKDRVFLFSVDSHDAFLNAPPDSKDQKMLEDLKRHNAAVSAAVQAQWEKEGLPTERGYLRGKIREARGQSPTSPPTP